MHRVRQHDVPFQGSSHQFVGADQGDVNVSVFLLSALPGRGLGPHRHPYDEVQFVREGRGLVSITLVSPYPNPTLSALISGTLVVRYRVESREL